MVLAGGPKLQRPAPKYSYTARYRKVMPDTGCTGGVRGEGEWASLGVYFFSHYYSVLFKVTHRPQRQDATSSSMHEHVAAQQQTHRRTGSPVRRSPCALGGGVGMRRQTARRTGPCHRATSQVGTKSVVGGFEDNFSSATGMRAHIGEKPYACSVCPPALHPKELRCPACPKRCGSPANADPRGTSGPGPHRRVPCACSMCPKRRSTRP